MKMGFFEESEGVRSSIRLIYIIGMLWLMMFCTAAMITKTASILEISMFFVTVSGVLTGSKLYQKEQEQSASLKREEIINLVK